MDHSAILGMRSILPNFAGGPNSKMKVDILAIDKPMAKKMLVFNEGNRPFKLWRAKQISAQLRTGEFLTTHQGIAFDWNGHLIDGQHRLWALDDTGITQELQVTWNAAPATFIAIDNGTARSGGDVFAVAGYANSTTVSATARHGVAYLRGAKTMVGGGSRVDSAARLSFAQARPGIEDAVRIGVQIKTACSMTASAAAAAHLLVDDASPNVDKSDWIEGLKSGANIDSGDPRLALRNALLTPGRMKDGVYLMALYIKAWNAYVTGKTIKKLTIVAGDRPQPLVIGGTALGVA